MAPILVRLLLNSFWRNSCKTVDVPCDYEASCFASSLVLFLPVWSSTTALWPVSTMNSLYSNYCISSLWVKSFGEQGAEDLSLFCVSYPFTIKCHSEVLGAISWTRFLSLQDFGRIRFCTLLPSDGCLVGIVQGTDLIDNQLIFCFPWSQGALHGDISLL
jgi:hypothetical protein